MHGADVMRMIMIEKTMLVYVHTFAACTMRHSVPTSPIPILFPYSRGVTSFAPAWYLGEEHCAKAGIPE